MAEIDLLKDASFLRKLDQNNIKTFYVKIVILDKNELPLRAIEGRISTGSITISGDSSIRRAGSLNFLAEEKDNDLTDIDNLIFMNKKIKILIGIENTIDEEHDPIIWFKQGIFVINNPSLTHTTNGVNISIQFKDKMCLLNGECGGGLPTSVTFDSYDQIVGLKEGLSDFPQDPNSYTVYQVNGKYYMWSSDKGWKDSKLEDVGERLSVPQRIFDIIQTLVCNYGGESINKIIINDVPLELKQMVRYVGKDSLYYNSATDVYTMDSTTAAENDGNWLAYNYNEDCGYVYTDFTYPGELISSIGENVCSVLDKIKQTLGNYEYFYDLDGNFVFQEIKNYLNTSYTGVQDVERTYSLSSEGLILSGENYYMDLSNLSQSIYTFNEGSALISSYSNAPNYNNIKNDFHIWGENTDGYVIHYHVAIKEKPAEPFAAWKVVDELDDNKKPTGRIHLAGPGEVGYDYTAADWRAELYLRGMYKQQLQQRPDIYEQELLDLFDSIYNMREKKFKADIVNHPNDLKYWFDYIEPAELYDISVDAIGPKVYSHQQSKIKKLYNTDVPQVILIDAGTNAISQAKLIQKCEMEGQPYARISEHIYKNIAIGTWGYTAQEVARDLLYRFTDYVSSISITSIPIYYLDVNNRITVQDRASGIYGDYVVKSITVPLDAKSTMSISASRALTRV